MSTPVYGPLAAESDSENQPLVPASTDGILHQRAVGWLKSVGKWSRENLLLLLTILSVVVGIIVGVSVHQAHPDRVAIQLIAFPGELFLRMLKMLILPLLIFSLMAGLGTLDTKVAGALGWRTVVYYFCTTVLAVILGLILVLSIRPGVRGKVEKPCDNSSLSIQEHQLETIDAILDLLRNLIPDNLFVATFKQAQTVYHDQVVVSWKDCVLQNNETFTNCSAAEELVRDMGLDCHNATREVHTLSVGTRDGMNILGIVVFSIVFAIFLSRLGEQGRKVVEAIAAVNEVIMSLVRLIMWYSPIGIASIIAGKLLEVEDIFALMEQIGLYMATVMLGLLIHGCLTLPLIYFLLTRSNPLKIVRGSLLALLTAFGTSSSSATLPITIRCLEENLAISPHVTRFMLPVGATVNMDGSALYEAVAAIFIAQVENVDVDFVKVIIISITATAASIGAAGVPSAGLVTMVIVLVAVGLPPEDVGLLLAVDWLLDRFRTPVNVLGDCYGAGIVYHHSKKYLPSSADHAHSAPQPPTASTPTRDNITGMEDSLPAELNQLSNADGCPRSQGEQSSHARDSGLPPSCSHDSRPAQAAVDVGGTEILLKEGTNQPREALNREDNEDTRL